MRLPAVLVLAMGVGSVAAQPPVAPPPKPVTGTFPVASDADAWAKLPPVKEPLIPEWARVLAGPLPKTTAKMLELDYLHRAANPLGPELAAMIRWTVADALKSEYGKAIAKADLEWAIPVGSTKISPAERVALAFAKKLTLEGHAITDKEFAEVLKEFGPEKTTAIVHTVAYANFHNRILLGLGIKGESPPAPPIAMKFDIDAAKVQAPARPPWEDLKSVSTGGLSVRVDWDKAGWDELNASQDKQKERSLRIPLPGNEAFEKLAGREKEQALKIRWNTVSMGYQPEMTRAWFAPLYAFYDESKPDRVFTNSMFWVVTRTNDCFY
jgi:alkylhydroperoxidase family enzyme